MDQIDVDLAMWSNPLEGILLIAMVAGTFSAFWFFKGRWQWLVFLGLPIPWIAYQVWTSGSMGWALDLIFNVSLFAYFLANFDRQEEAPTVPTDEESRPPALKRPRPAGLFLLVVAGVAIVPVSFPALVGQARHHFETGMGPVAAAIPIAAIITSVFCGALLVWVYWSGK